MAGRSGSRLPCFTQALMGAVAADVTLSPWLQSRRAKLTLAPGLPQSSYA